MLERVTANRLAGMEMFIQVVGTYLFSAAARQLRVSQLAAPRMILAEDAEGKLLIQIAL
jgi:DNA-binding transcriptional LysR family regulator